MVELKHLRPIMYLILIKYFCLLPVQEISPVANIFHDHHHIQLCGLSLWGCNPQFKKLSSRLIFYKRITIFTSLGE